MNPVEAFEQQIREIIDVKHAIAVDHGSSAINIALQALGLRSGGIVITTPFTFVATIEEVIRVGGVPHFVDIDPETYCLNPEQVTEAIDLYELGNNRLWGVLAVHLFGRMADIKTLQDICCCEDLHLLEDASQAFGVHVNGRYAGTFGHAGTFSFYASKMPYTYEGGAIVTGDDEVAEICEQLRNHGKDRNGRVVRLGGNHRLAWPLASHGETMLRLHRKASLSETASYGPEEGYYPYLVYQEPFFENNRHLWTKSDCPVAEEVAARIRSPNP